MYLADVFTVSANLAGIPAISIPCGFTDDGLPIGLQLQASSFDESLLLNAAHRFQLRNGLAFAEADMSDPQIGHDNRRA